MRFGRDDLVFKALCALDEAIEDCNAGPIKPSYGLRFALTYLYAVGEGDRSPFDCFWQLIQDPLEFHGAAASYVRTSYARSNFSAICRSVGLNPTAQNNTELSRARLPKAERHRLLREEDKRRRIVDAMQESQADAVRLDLERRARP